MLKENNHAVCSDYTNMYEKEKEECCIVTRVEISKAKSFAHHQLIVVVYLVYFFGQGRFRFLRWF